MSNSSNPAFQAIHRLHNKSEQLGDQLDDFMVRQASGETPDPQEFAQLLEAKSVMHSATQAQFNLLQKPLKVVLNESRG